MLKLVFYTQDHRLKVRHATAEDSFASSVIWNNLIEFILTDTPDFTIIWTSFLPDLKPKYAEALLDLVGARFPISEKFKKLSNLSPKMCFTNPTQEWIFFGGTFNPWHKGHQSCLNLVPESKVCLIIPDRNPHKEIREIHQVSTILEISTKATLKKNQFLVPTFLLKEEKNPTIHWIKKMKMDYPEDKLSLLMGFDSFSSLGTWTESKELIKLLDSLYVVSRLEDDLEREEALKRLEILGFSSKVHFLGRHEFEHISSTDIRNKKGT